MPKHTIPAAALAALLAAAPAAAQINAETFRDGRTADLAVLCAAPESDPMHVAALAWCHGFLIGVGQYHGSTAAAGGPRKTLFCLPAPEPTLDEARTAFVRWVRSHPQHGADRAVDGLLRFAVETYPCAPTPAAPTAAKRHHP
jgi:hypothetical protein